MDEGEKAKYGSWVKAASEIGIQLTGTQPLQTYIGKRQAILAELVDLRNIF